jgi:hypothetical protein
MVDERRRCATQELRQMVLECEQTEQSDRTLKLDQQIHVTRPRGFVTGNRTKEDQRFDTKLLAQFVTMVGQDFQYLITLHAALSLLNPLYCASLLSAREDGTG